MKRTILAVSLLLAFGASAQESSSEGNDQPPAASQGAQASQPRTGYIITDSGQIIFPNAPQPSGDTSTLSGAGPNVSTGPQVGTGPEVSTGPVVGPP
jgi:hypothetical protein